MANALVSLMICAVLMNWLTPLAFLHADRYVARQRLPQQPHKATSAPTTHLPTQLHWLHICDSLARLTRSGYAARDALIEILGEEENGPSTVQRINNAHTVQDFLVSASTQCDGLNAYALTLLSRAVVETNFVPQALDHVGRTLRDLEQNKKDARAAAAQAQLSARVLTVFPIVALVLGVVCNATVRRGLMSPVVLMCLVVGALLNTCGWLWIKASIHRSLVESHHQNIFEIVDNICVSMYTGMSARTAMMRLPHLSDIATTLSTSLCNGVPFTEALQILNTPPTHFSQCLTSLLVQAETDGLPVLQSVRQLAQEARLERRRDIDIRLRQLPTRLTMPVVLCILPSFLLSTMAPLLRVVLSHIAFPLAVM